MVDTTRGPFREATEQERGMLDAVITSCVFIAAVAAYVFSSVEKFADRGDLFIGGMFIAFALIAALVVKLKRAPVAQVWGVIVMLCVAAILLFITGSEAVTRSEWNDRRCLRIQHAMLRPTARTRGDLADVFTALQCRPQGAAPFKLPNPRGGGDPDLAMLREYDELVSEALADEVQVDRVEATPASPVSIDPRSGTAKALAGPQRSPTPSVAPRPAKPGETAKGK